MLQTGRVITTGEYGGLKGFRHVYESMGIHFRSDKQARKILDLVQYANLHNQKPLTDDELRFIAEHPKIVSKVLLRHSNLQTTQKYLGKISDLEAMRWIDKLHG